MADHDDDYDHYYGEGQKYSKSHADDAPGNGLNANIQNFGMKDQIDLVNSMNVPKNSHKVKQKVCMFWKKGKCKFGDKCDYLHVDIEDRLPICTNYKTYGYC